MVNLRVSKHELEMLILWAKIHKDYAETLGVPLEQDELYLIKKLRKAKEGSG